MFREGLPLGAFDLLELVDLGALAVIRSADPFGEQRLKPGIGGHAIGSFEWRIVMELL
jgi:hypothetical protein